MPRFRLRVNDAAVEVDADERTPLLWILRERMDLTGAKYGCGRGYCGACMVHLDGRAVPSCMIPVSNVGDAMVTTIEGLADGEALHPVQRAWIQERVPQCGYCQAGQVMSAAALLARDPAPTSEEVDDAMGANVCRCGTYVRIRRAVARAAELMTGDE